MRAHPLNLVGVDIGRGVFDRGGKVEDDLIIDRRLPDIRHRFTDFQSEIELGAGEAFRGILKSHMGALVNQGLGVLLDPSGAGFGDTNNVLFGGVEDIFALGRRGGIVEMEDDVFRALHGFARAGDQLLPALAKDLDGNVIGDSVLVDQAADEIELDLRSRRKADFNFFETDLDEHIEVFDFLFDIHGLGEGLITIAEINTAPNRSLGQHAAGPLAVGQIDRWERSVFGNRCRLHDETD